MTSQEAEKIIQNLKSGKRYEFSNQYDGIREVMEYSKQKDCYTIIIYYAYGDNDKEIAEYTEQKIREMLEYNFSYKDFEED